VRVSYEVGDGNTAKRPFHADFAFPSIGTGAFGYPIELAAPIAVAETRDFVRIRQLR
jgi:O-acetyl-ADP-ribose deacetylase (regulator of RNase III)